MTSALARPSPAIASWPRGQVREELVVRRISALARRPFVTICRKICRLPVVFGSRKTQVGWWIHMIIMLWWWLLWWWLFGVYMMNIWLYGEYYDGDYNHHITWFQTSITFYLENYLSHIFSETIWEYIRIMRYYGLHWYDWYYPRELVGGDWDMTCILPWIGNN